MTELASMDGVPRIQGSESFEAFVRREYRAVLGLAIVLAGSRTAGEEIAQDAFLEALRQWGRVRTMDYPNAWIRRVVSNRSVSRFRRLMAETRALLRYAQNEHAERWAASPGADEAMDVWSEVRLLPRRQAQVVALTYLEGLSRREVAVVLGCGEETVKTHLERARKTLTERLDGREVGDVD